jgi:hypothetical protein
MSMNYLFGVSQETLETSLVVAQEDYMEMTAIVASGAGDINSQRQTMGSLEKRIEQILRALNRLDPDKYPIDQVTRNERTGVAFS